MFLLYVEECHSEYALLNNKHWEGGYVNTKQEMKKLSISSECKDFFCQLYWW